MKSKLYLLSAFTAKTLCLIALSIFAVGIGQINAQYTAASNSMPLLLGFTGQIGNNAVQLSWTMENETSSKYFVIERSGDNDSFDSIGAIIGVNNSHEMEYSYTDTHPLTGKNYYRLRQVSLTGDSKYSKVILLDNSNIAASFGIFPNPAVSQLNYTIISQSSDQVMIQVYNLSGILVSTQQMQLNAGVNKQAISLTSLKNGQYFLRVNNRQGTVNYVQAFAKI